MRKARLAVFNKNELDSRGNAAPSVLAGMSGHAPFLVLLV